MSTSGKAQFLLSPKQWVLFFCLLQLAFWTFGPFLVRYNLVYDTMEGLVWGNQWLLGYDKHPPFAAWMTAIFAKLHTPPDLPVYFLAQFCVVITFLCVWRLAKEYLDETGACLAVIMLTGVLYYSNQVERVTPDTIQGPVWALLALTFYFAVIRERTGLWVFTGILAGIGFLTKYQIFVLLPPLALSLLFTTVGHKALKSPGPWIAALTAIIVTIPHLIWMHEHDYPALEYFARSYIEDSSGGGWLNHLKAPWRFALSNLGNVILLPLIAWPLYSATRQAAPALSSDYGQDQFKRVYLFCLALGPMLLSLVMGAINGKDMVPRWATPYFAWLPLYLLVWLNRDISRKAFKRVVITSLCVGLTLWSLRTGYLYYKPYIKNDYWQADEFVPAREAMETAEALWQEEYSSPLPYLGGGHYHVMALTSHSEDGTVPFSNLDPESSPWMSEADFLQAGGIIALEENRKDFSRDIIEKKYSQLEFLGTYHFRPYVPDDLENVKFSVVSYFLLRPEGK